MSRPKKSLIPTTAGLANNMPITIVVNGLSGRRYEFPPNGVLTDIDLSDVEDLLSKRYIAEACCGSNVKTDTPYFTRLF